METICLLMCFQKNQGHCFTWRYYRTSAIICFHKSKYGDCQHCTFPSWMPSCDQEVFFFFIQENIVLIPIHYLSPLLNHQVSHVDVFDINIGALISMCCCWRLYRSIIDKSTRFVLSCSIRIIKKYFTTNGKIITGANF